jgi:hypothetical protein
VQTERKTWNDDRMDEFAARTEASFGEVREEFKEVRRETRDLGIVLRSEMKELRREMNERFISLDRRFDTLTAALIAGFISLIVIHFVG